MGKEKWSIGNENVHFVVSLVLSSFTCTTCSSQKRLVSSWKDGFECKYRIGCLF